MRFFLLWGLIGGLLLAACSAQAEGENTLRFLALGDSYTIGERVPPGERYVLDLGMNQEELASLVGLRREQINRMLRNWRQLGLIEYASTKITILDLPAAHAERDKAIGAPGDGW